ncbi:MAG: 1,4-alpha-glucan branching protein GlgB [bacterium]
MSEREFQRLEAIARGREARPFDVLGGHPHPSGGWVVRAFVPDAQAVAVERDGEQRSAEWVHADGVFEARFPDATSPFPYRLVIRTEDGAERRVEDPYRFAPTLSPSDLAAFHRGEDFRAWERLGAHRLRREGVDGVRFAVWAPNAERVSVVGSFNDWNARVHGMFRLPGGVWEIFVPGVPDGALYKFDIRTRHGGRRIAKADPFGFAMELRPSTASVVAAPGGAGWKDGTWMRSRAKRQGAESPFAVYEVHLGSWRRGRRQDPPSSGGEAGRAFLGYGELAEQLVPYVRDLGFTHVELMPVTEHPFDGSWGYQTVGCFAPTSRFGPPQDLARLIDAAHRARLGVILDWVPGHFPRDAHGLGWFDGEHLYEPEDPRRGVHLDWGTFIYDFAKPEVRSFLLSSAVYWIERFHADGLRVDAVASMLYLDYGRKAGEWLPNAEGGRENWEAVSFLKTLSRVVGRECPGALLIAEESTSWEGITKSPAASRRSLGFDRKWNMGWMNDTLSFFQRDPLARGRCLEKLTFGLTYAFAERFLLPLSHDEVVHGKASLLSKMPGATPEQRFANLRLLFGWMWAHPGKKLLFMGGEIGQWTEWNHDAELDWDLLEHPPHRGLFDYVRELNRLYAKEAALHVRDDSWAGFEWLDFSDTARSVVSFVRRSGGARSLAVIANFAGARWRSLRVGVPRGGSYRVALSSAETRWGGDDDALPAGRVLRAEPEPAGGQPFSLLLDVPPLSITFLAFREAPARPRSPRAPRARRSSTRTR